jgi:tripartite-type tricarboxylate transporter receptor subunit TctC
MRILRSSPALSLLVGCCSAFITFMPQLAAQEYPAKAVHMVVPFTAGGGTDVNIRRLAERLNRLWGKPVVVDNLAGGAGNVAAASVAGSKPDGYTVFFATHPIIAINPSLYEKLPFNPDRDFAPVVLVTENPQVLLVSPKLPQTKLTDLIALAKAKPDALHFGSGGQGTLLHLSGELFKARAGIQLMHVPYKGGAPAQVALESGEIQLLFDNSQSVIGVIRGGRVRGLAVASLTRLSALPDLPTFDESGFPGFVSILGTGMLVPAGTPSAVISALNRDVNTTLRDAVLVKQMGEFGVNLTGGTPEQFRSFLAAERKMWAEIIRKYGIKLD